MAGAGHGGGGARGRGLLPQPLLQQAGRGRAGGPPVLPCVSGPSVSGSRRGDWLSAPNPSVLIGSHGFTLMPGGSGTMQPGGWHWCRPTWMCAEQPGSQGTISRARLAVSISVVMATVSSRRTYILSLSFCLTPLGARRLGLGVIPPLRVLRAPEHRHVQHSVSQWQLLSRRPWALSWVELGALCTWMEKRLRFCRPLTAVWSFPQRRVVRMARVGSAVHLSPGDTASLHNARLPLSWDTVRCHCFDVMAAAPPSAGSGHLMRPRVSPAPRPCTASRLCFAVTRLRVPKCFWGGYPGPRGDRGPGRGRGRLQVCSLMGGRSLSR